jgi:signal transduction histidine kinase
MAGRRGHGRSILVALIGLLFAGIVAAVWMSFRAQDEAERAAVEQAEKIADNSLSLVFDPTDLTAPVTDERASELTQQVSAIVLDPSDFTSVTVWSSGGQILYATETGRIGNTLAGERGRIRTAIRGTVQTRISGGRFSVMVPLRTVSGLATDTAVELIRPDDTIVAAAGPWRTNALFLTVALLATVGAAWRVGRTHAAAPLPTGRPAPQPSIRPEPARRIEVPTPGLKEEADARRLAESRAQAAEERLALLQEQYRKALEDLQTFQQMARESITRPDARVEERALRAEGLVRTLEGQVKALQDEREQLAARVDELSAARPGAAVYEERRLLEAEQEAIGLRAELEGVQTQLAVAHRELGELRAGQVSPSDLQEELAATRREAKDAVRALEAAQSDAAAARAELEDLRTELRGLRTEEQRAAMLEDELRATKAELQGASASHRAELVEREAAFEEKVRAAREQFQHELAEIEASYREQLSLKEQEYASRLARAESQSAASEGRLASLQQELELAQAEARAAVEERDRAFEAFTAREAEFETLRSDLSARDDHAAAYLAELDGARAELQVVRDELAQAQETIASTQAELLAARSGASDESERARRLEHERGEAEQLAARLTQQLEDAAAENAELNRKLQELEARRALELAEDTGRAQIDDLLRVTQDRLAGQTEKLMAAEDRIHDLERELEVRVEQLEEVQAQLRQHQMSDALREIREPQVDGTAPDEEQQEAEPEERRASAPFMRELSADARKSLSRMTGIAQLLKHKKDAKDQAQLVKQLAAHLRRLDRTMADLLDADNLARGTIELAVKRTNLEALVQRVVEEAGSGADHDLRVETEELSIGIDPQRTEQIVAGLLRASSDRTASGKTITVRVRRADGGAIISVEDPESPTDASMSPVVRRFAEVQGGWAKVEAGEGGGSAFRVFLPDAAPERAAGDVQVLVDEGQAEPVRWEPEGAKLLVQELHRLAGE